MIINLIFVCLIGVLCVICCKSILKNNNTLFSQLLLLCIVIIHFSVFFFHFNWGLTRPVDSKTFFEIANTSTNWLNMFGMGNRSIPFIIYPLTTIGLSYFSISFLFSVFGFLGYLTYFKILTENIKEKTVIEKIVILIFFIAPSIHFWTASISKEAIIFLLMAIVFKKVKSNKINNWLIILSMLILLLIRPYLAAILMLPIIILNYNKFTKTYKIVVGASALIAIPIIIKFLKIKNLNSFKSNYYELAMYARENGNSSIDLLDSNYLERVFLVLFRPLFLDAKTVMQYYASIENVFWLLFFCACIYLLKNIKIALKDSRFKFLVIYITTIVSFYGIYMYNLGLASRMRVLFVPYSILLLLILIRLEIDMLKSKN